MVMLRVNAGAGLGVVEDEMTKMAEMMTERDSSIHPVARILLGRVRKSDRRCVQERGQLIPQLTSNKNGLRDPILPGIWACRDILTAAIWPCGSGEAGAPMRIK
jgi:hypothetical protein